MVKKIGNWFFVVLLCSNLYNYTKSEIKLYTADINGDIMTSFVQGIPFIAEVQVTSNESFSQTPQVRGLQKFHIDDQSLVSTINSNINGNRSVRKVFRYVLRSDKMGTFEIGPATIKLNDETSESGIVSVQISDKQKNAHAKLKLELHANITNPVIGQDVPLTIRFYPGRGAQLIQMSNLEVPHGTIEPVVGPYQGDQHVDGQKIPYLEWRTVWYPARLGKTEISAIKAIYRDDTAAKRNQFDMFGFFGAQQTKQIYSNGLTITVRALPEFSKPVSAVGQLSKLAAVIEQPTSRIGEGVVYKLAITGHGNMPSLMPPELQMPDGLKYYESKNYLQSSGVDKENTKVFEYIVQGTKPGDFFIPAQELYFYDVVKSRFEQLKSEPVMLQVRGDVIPINALPAADLSARNDQETEPPSQKTKPILDGPWQVQSERAIPLPVFIALMALLLVGAVILNLYPIIARKLLHNDRVQLTKLAKKAHAQLKQARAQNDVGKIAPIFLDYIAQLFPENESAQTTIALKLQQKKRRAR